MGNSQLIPKFECIAGTQWAWDYTLQCGCQCRKFEAITCQTRPIQKWPKNGLFHIMW